MSSGRWAFSFDADGCSGCKACQAACKDRSGLEVGVLWRRVYEISGGDWQAQGAAWTTDAFAYNLSVGCNHCDRPICVEVCPTGAMHRAGGGIVLVDAKRCVGCRYCSWACPYGAPQFDISNGVMTKCDFCQDYLEQGLQPVCAAACPLRLLEAVEDDEANCDLQQAAPIFPLPQVTLTVPALHIRPPQPVIDGRAAAKGRLANAEEVGPAHSDERSLAWFTVLFPAAVGLLVGLVPVQMALLLGAGESAALYPTAFWFFLASALLSGGGLLASLWHLGRPRRAWRALRNWRSSPLSREVWLASAFFGLTLIATVLAQLGRGSFGEDFAVWTGCAALVGVAALIGMGRVYHLRTIPLWHKQRPQVLAWQTALALGGLGAAGIMLSLPAAYGGSIGLGLAVTGILGLLWILIWELDNRDPSPVEIGLHHQPGVVGEINRLRRRGRGLNAAALVASLLAFGAPLLLVAACLLAFAGELQRRLGFYLSRTG